ncbi:MAG: oligopeptide:H+ symporter [Methanobrevibacter sp.]|jgi:POT family proton-dependent oligopeptide transporter|nr:oligopeptide:H+ symporter [Candidatus Methanovirga aequatorialis]
MKLFKKNFFGHPYGLLTLFFTELWERFSYYGMSAILLYYLYYSVSNGGLGLDPALSTQIVAIYGSLVYLSGVLGGFVSDRLLGPYKTVLYGGILIMIGHVVLTLAEGVIFLFLALTFIIIGTGLLKPNISTMVGLLYDKNDQRKDSAYTIFYLGINMGSFISPIVVSYLADVYNFHVGFLLAAIGMFSALLIYFLTRKSILKQKLLHPNYPLIKKDKIKLIYAASIFILFSLMVIYLNFIGYLNVENVIVLISIFICLIIVGYFVMILSSKKMDKMEINNVIAYIPLFVGAVIFFVLFDQTHNVLAWFVDTNVSLGWILPSWFQSLNPMFIIILTPIFSWLWSKDDQISDPIKFVLGLLLAGISFLILAVVLILAGGAKISSLYLVVVWIILTLGELLISPIGLSLTSKLSPKAFQSQFMSLWFLSTSVSQAICALIVKFYKQDPIMYFISLGMISILFGCGLFMFKDRINSLINV